MNINKTINGTSATLSLEGRLDTITSPQLETVLNEIFPDKTELIFNLTDLEYISSSGLRVLLKSQKTMNKQGSMVLTNVCESVMEVFEITGFSDLLTIK